MKTASRKLGSVKDEQRKKPSKPKARPSPSSQNELFTVLRAILDQHAKRFRISRDSEREYYLETKGAHFRGQPVFFGAVRRVSNSVSFYVMSLYIDPAFEVHVPPELRRLKTGKTCFKFKNADPIALKKMDDLTALALDDYRSRGWA